MTASIWWISSNVGALNNTSCYKLDCQLLGQGMDSLHKFVSGSSLGHAPWLENYSEETFLGNPDCCLETEDLPSVFRAENGVGTKVWICDIIVGISGARFISYVHLSQARCHLGSCWARFIISSYFLIV